MRRSHTGPGALVERAHVFVATKFHVALMALAVFAVAMPGAAAGFAPTTGCEISLSPDTLSPFSDAGGPGQVSVTASSECAPWWATSDWWISIPDPGTSPLAFQVEPNDSMLPRVGQILVGDQILYIFQFGVPGLIFREMAADKKQGTWGDVGVDQIAGFDHVGLSVDNSVFESHPGWIAGTYFDPFLPVGRTVNHVDGVQSQHSTGTFVWESTSPDADGGIAQLSFVPIQRALADQMAARISGRTGSLFQKVDFGLGANTVDERLARQAATLDPGVQKGANGKFTGVGLIEWAAEQAGENNGQGFIPRGMEAMTTAGGAVISFLSPQLLAAVLEGRRLGLELDDWLVGLVDPVDFILTDPQQRRLGHTSALGTLAEIPDAQYAGDGTTEQFVLLNPMPGDYTLELFGLGDTTISGLGSATAATAFVGALSSGATRTLTFRVDNPDVDADGIVNAWDNCPLVSNADQADSNGNGVGNACEPVVPLDKTPPVLSLPADSFVEATGAGGATVSFSTSAVDAVDGPVPVTCVPASGSVFAIATAIVQCSASDTHGNAAIGTFAITVRDTTPPTLSLPASVTKEATGPGGAAATFGSSATDLVDGTVGVSCLPASGSTFALGTTHVNCSAADVHGNLATGSFNVLVRDTIAPRVTPPPNQTVPQTLDGGANVSYPAPVTVEQGSGLAYVDCLPATGSLFPVGTTTVTCTAKDVAGNVGSATFTVTVTPRTNGSADGRMFGIGHIDERTTHHHFAFQASQIKGKDAGRLEYWLADARFCRGDDDDELGRDGDQERDYGRDHRKPVNHFEATAITSVTFADDPVFRPAKPGQQQPSMDTVVMTGRGRWNNRAGYSFEMRATDQGEPGRGRDQFTLVVKDPAGNIVANVSHVLSGGNIQSLRLRTPPRPH